MASKVKLSDKSIDQELVKAMREGDLNAYSELVNKYTQKVHNLAFRISRNEEDTEEIVQDVFVTVYNKIDKFEGKAAFSSWLYRITANTAFMKLRKRKQHLTVSLEEFNKSNNDYNPISAPLSNSLELGVPSSLHEVRESIEKALFFLPHEYRSIFVLRDVDGLSNQDVSSILGITVPAVKSRLHRSRLMLRKKLQRFYQDYVSDDRIIYGPNSGSVNFVEH
jgi:RNA polymerase sigma-70 factor, ECF subfamily